MILIADSGSTTTTWCILNTTSGESSLVKTAGINPFYQDEKAIVETLEREFDSPKRDFEALYFYGAGCANPAVIGIVKNALTHFFTVHQVEVASDLMAAAHALCGHNEGIACILGTGSNSCHYNGREIVKNVSPLGFILGDEGSGAVIGKKLLADLLKNQLPDSVIKAFFAKHKLSPADILDHIYKKPFPNRFAAQFARFISENIEEASLEKIVNEAFNDFFTRNVMQYDPATSLPVHFTGSIAWHFKEQLKGAADAFNVTIGQISKDPMPGLIQYHLNQK